MGPAPAPLLGDSAGAWAIDRVGEAENESSAAPHAAQKRLSSGAVRLQEGQ
jgi:hypothetical protein